MRGAFGHAQKHSPQLIELTAVLIERGGGHGTLRQLYTFVWGELEDLNPPGARTIVLRIWMLLAPPEELVGAEWKRFHCSGRHRGTTLELGRLIDLITMSRFETIRPAEKYFKPLHTPPRPSD